MLKKNKLIGILSLAAVIPLLFSSCSEKDAETDVSDTGTTVSAENESIIDPNAPSTENGNMGEVKLETGNLYAVISIKDYGDVTVKLFPDIAPAAVENFVKAANEGYYNGKNFHRVIADFMIQGGSLNGDGASDPAGVAYGVERNPNARHFYGALAMAKNGIGENGLQFYLVNNKDSNVFIEIQEQLASIEEYVTTLKETLDEIESYIAENGDGDVNQSTVTQYKELYNHYSALAEYVKNADSSVVEKYGEKGGVPFLDGGYTVFGQTVDGFDVIDSVSSVDVLASPSNTEEISVPIIEIIIEKIEIKTY